VRDVPAAQQPPATASNRLGTTDSRAGESFWLLGIPRSCQIAISATSRPTAGHGPIRGIVDIRCALTPAQLLQEQLAGEAEGATLWTKGMKDATRGCEMPMMEGMLMGRDSVRRTIGKQRAWERFIVSSLFSVLHFSPSSSSCSVWSSFPSISLFVPLPATTRPSAPVLRPLPRRSHSLHSPSPPFPSCFHHSL
jgi:hypothetical protein